MHVPEAVSQTRHRPSKDAVASMVPSHTKSTETTGSECAPNERMQRAVRTSHSLTVSSYEPLATMLPRGLYAQQQT